MILVTAANGNQGKPTLEWLRVRRTNANWQWRRLMYYPKAVIGGDSGGVPEAVECDVTGLLVAFP